MIIRMSGVFLRIVIPCFCTGVGSCGMASVTRFCTMTRAVFRSVPMSKVTVSVYEPSLPHLRRHVEHALDAVDLLLDRRRHRVGHHLGAGPRIGDRHLHRRRRDRRVLRDRQREQRDPAGQRDDDRQHRREDRPVDEEARDHAAHPRHLRRRAPA